MAANPGPGLLCHSCAKASGADPFKKPASRRKRKDPTEKRKIISFEETERVRSLTAMCIEVCEVSVHLFHIESQTLFGYIMDPVINAYTSLI